jgi:hypothetical protein
MPHSRDFTRLRPRLSDAYVLLASVALVTAGCSKSDRPLTVPVAGTVTFAGGPPPSDGSLRFAPIEVAEGLPNRPGRADFDASGKFSARSFAENDGLVPGTYKVMLECWKVVPVDGKPGVSHIPTGYEPPELVVDRDAEGVKFDLDVPAKN